ncbi:MAG TPA: Uma2 family endonuclease [Pedobacter sp.]|jgi:Uma2 family endonuclease
MQLSDLDLNKTYSYADYLKWTFDERIELIKGKIFKMTPAPNTYHQRVSGAAFNELYNYLKKKPCSVFSAPFDVRLPRKSIDDNTIYTVVQPDICVICDPIKVDKKGCIGAPDIVVEILSPGNNKKELQNKFEVYEEALIREYWIIHPDEHTFLKYVLNEEGKYVAQRLLTVGDEVTTPILAGFVLSLEEVFSNPIE